MKTAAREYTILEDGHVVFVVEVLVETEYSVLNVRNGCTRTVKKCSGIKGSMIEVSKSFCG